MVNWSRLVLAERLERPARQEEGRERGRERRESWTGPIMPRDSMWEPITQPERRLVLGHRVVYSGQLLPAT